MTDAEIGEAIGMTDRTVRLGESAAASRHRAARMTPHPGGGMGPLDAVAAADWPALSELLDDALSLRADE